MYVSLNAINEFTSRVFPLKLVSSGNSNIVYYKINKAATKKRNEVKLMGVVNAKSRCEDALEV